MQFHCIILLKFQTSKIYNFGTNISGNTRDVFRTSQTSMMKLFVEIVYSEKPLTIFAKDPPL